MKIEISAGAEADVAAVPVSIRRYVWLALRATIAQTQHCNGGQTHTFKAMGEHPQGIGTKRHSNSESVRGLYHHIASAPQDSLDI